VGETVSWYLEPRGGGTTMGKKEAISATQVSSIIATPTAEGGLFHRRTREKVWEEG